LASVGEVAPGDHQGQQDRATGDHEAGGDGVGGVLAGGGCSAVTRQGQNDGADDGDPQGVAQLAEGLDEPGSLAPLRGRGPVGRRCWWATG
jgi:hypothetical protein